MNIKLPKLEQYQQAVFKYILENPVDRTVMVKSPRQVGKSIMLEVILLWSALNKPNSVSISISPIAAQARKLFKDIKKFAAKLITSANGTLLEIEFLNGSQILFKSAESGDNLRGETVKGSGICVVDEAAYIDEDFYYDVVVPFVNVSHRPILLASTPRGKVGLFFNMFQKGLLDDPYIKAFDWCDYDLSKFLTPDLLERYRTQLPMRTFTSEYLGQFVDGTSVVFGDITGAVRNDDVKYDTSLPVYLSIDWSAGAGADNTVISFVQIRNGKLVLIKQIAFNDKGPNQTIDTIMGAVQEVIRKGITELNVIIEKNSIGTVYGGLLADAVSDFEEMFNANVSYKNEIEVNIQQFVTTNQSKKKLVECLTNLFEHNWISIPNDRFLKSELTTFECKVDKNGTITYNAASGFHDDRVMSLGFAAYMLYEEILSYNTNGKY